MVVNLAFLRVAWKVVSKEKYLAAYLALIWVVSLAVVKGN
jgi:hypothetical protein